MKAVQPITLLFFLFLATNSRAVVTSNLSAAADSEFRKIKAKEIEKLVGHRLSFFQKVELKFFQKTIRKLNDEELTENQKKQAQTSMILGISSLSFLALSAILLFPALILLSLPTAILAISLGRRSRRGNSNKKGKVGIVTGSISLVFLTVLIAAAILVLLGGQVVTVNF